MRKKFTVEFEDEEIEVIDAAIKSTGETLEEFSKKGILARANQVTRASKPSKYEGEFREIFQSLIKSGLPRDQITASQIRVRMSKKTNLATIRRWLEKNA